ncbi:MAG: thymidine phosphorylase [Parvularculaceae bacterium]
MLFKEIIRRKRDGGALSADEIERFVQGLADGGLPAEQVSALAMAIFLNSMTAEETGALTSAMAASGTIIDWRAEDIGGPVVDKHSTGGVGDKVSFPLAPIAAACGCFVPMISGRGLGHTGGTLDKIESIPGYDSTPGLDALKKTVKSVGCAIIGQTDDIAPADRRFYAIRDVTGTVESIPLITASILSKKAAAGNEALVMDVKTGSGAFMATVDDARTLAQSIISTAATIGLKTRALITDMSQVLGRTAGNAVEIKESVDYLKNLKRDKRLDEVVQSLCAEMLVLTGIEDDRAAARARTEAAIVSGKAAEIFGRMITTLGGPSDFLERSDHYLPTAKVIGPAYADEEGYLAAVDARAVGNAIISLGGGRRRAGDALDLSVGFTDIASVGEHVGQDRPLAVIHAASPDALEQATRELKAACKLAAERPEAAPVIRERVE